MLHGIDVSNWQDNIDMFIPESDFVIMKATEGVSFKDGKMRQHYASFTGNNFDAPSSKCYGFYHYARPEFNTPEAEAEAFLHTIEPHIGEALLALDWEGEALKHPVSWALTWLRHVYGRTGVKPVLYTGKFEINTGKYKPIATEDYGIWVASWEETRPKIRDWEVMALWQYSSHDVDRNYFFGDAKAWKSYAKGKGMPQPDTLKVGMLVRPLTRYAYDGTKCAEFLLQNIYEVMEVKGDRVVFGKKGVITAAYHKKDLQVVH